MPKLISATTPTEGLKELLLHLGPGSRMEDWRDFFDNDVLEEITFGFDPDDGSVQKRFICSQTNDGDSMVSLVANVCFLLSVAKTHYGEPLRVPFRGVNIFELPRTEGYCLDKIFVLEVKDDIGNAYVWVCNRTESHGFENRHKKRAMAVVSLLQVLGVPLARYELSYNEAQEADERLGNVLPGVSLFR